MKFKNIAALLCSAAMLASFSFAGCGLIQFKKQDEEGSEQNAENTENAGNNGNTGNENQNPSNPENPSNPSNPDNPSNPSTPENPAEQPNESLLTTEYIVRYGASTYGYNWLATQPNGANLQEFYRAIDAKCMEVWNGTAQFSTDEDGEKKQYPTIGKVYSTKIDMAEASSVYRVYTYDHPYAYWLRTACLYGRRGNGVNDTVFVSVLVEDDFNTLQKINAVKGEINANISAVYNMAEGLTDPYDISLFYYKQLALMGDYGTYEKDGAYYASQETWAHSIEGIFDSDKNTNPVCEGYAKSYQLMLNLSGVENVYCIGHATSDGTGGGGGHAWNMIKLNDNKWYYCDVTWDDGNNSSDYSSGTADVNYFAVSSTENVRGKTFIETHISGTPTNLNGYYLYDLPTASDAAYSCEFPVNATHETEDFIFRRNGLNSVCVYRIKTNGPECTIPETVTVGGREYTVTEIDSRDITSTVVYPVLAGGSRVNRIYLGTNIRAIHFGAFSASVTYELHYSGTLQKWYSVFIENEAFKFTPMVYFKDGE